MCRSPSNHSAEVLVRGRALRGLEQLREVLLPNSGPGVGAMAMRLFRSGQQYEAAVPDAFDFAFGDAKFRRIDEVIGGVDLQQRRLDLFESRRGVVVP